MKKLRNAMIVGSLGLGTDIVELAYQLSRTFYQDDLQRVPDLGKRITFCSTCFRRGWQLRKALPMTLVVLWPWRKHLKVVVVLFRSAESDDLREWLQEHCAVALTERLLFIAEARLPGGYWHASIAKNTAHKAAIELFPEMSTIGDSGLAHYADDFLVNLDGDNIITPTYLECLMREVKMLGLRDVLGAQGGHPGTTGRVCLFADTSIRMGGYDEQFLPMGYQDIDIQIRCSHMGGGDAQDHRQEEPWPLRPQPLDVPEASDGPGETEERGPEIQWHVVGRHEPGRGGLHNQTQPPHPHSKQVPPPIDWQLPEIVRFMRPPLPPFL